MDDQSENFYQISSSPSKNKPIYTVHSDGSLELEQKSDYRNSDPLESLSELPAQWVAPGYTIHVAGVKLPGMVYISSSQEQRDASTFHDLNPIVYSHLKTVPVSSSSPEDQSIALSDFSWSYAQLSSEQRGAYLHWLAHFSTQKDVSEAYVLLFILGLEKRLFCHNTTTSENRSILFRAQHLALLHQNNIVLREALEKFIDLLTAFSHAPEDLLPSFGRASFGSVPFVLRLALGHKIKHGEPISWKWLLDYYMAHPQARMGDAFDVAFDAFKSHFSHLFQKKFPQGLSIPASREELTPATYESVSGRFELDVTSFFSSYPDITLYPQIMKEAQKLVDEAQQALAPFVYYEKTKTLDHTQRHFSPHPHAHLQGLYDDVKVKLDEVHSSSATEASSWVSVKAEEVFALLKLKDSEIVHKSDLIPVADFFAQRGIILAPDPYFARKMPEKHQSILFHRCSEESIDLQAQNDLLKDQYFFFEVGCLVAYADGEVVDEERQFLAQKISDLHINPVEKLRLRSNLEWLLDHPPHFKSIKGSLAALPAYLKQEVAAFVVQTMMADHLFDLKGEMEVMLQLFDTIGVSRDFIFEHLHQKSLQPTARKQEQSSSEASAMTPGGHGMTVSSPEAETSPQTEGFSTAEGSSVAEGSVAEGSVAEGSVAEGSSTDHGSLPTDDASGAAHHTVTISLPPELFAESYHGSTYPNISRRGYANVGQLLEDIFSDDTTPDITDESDKMQQGDYLGLDADHSKILTALLDRRVWLAADLRNLIRNTGLMEKGAVETINDWAYQRFDDALLDFDETQKAYHINETVRGMIAEKENAAA